MGCDAKSTGVLGVQKTVQGEDEYDHDHDYALRAMQGTGWQSIHKKDVAYTNIDRALCFLV